MIKITKGMARKLYEQGSEIMVLPDRVKPTSKLASWLTKAEGVDFDRLCETIFFYNCSPKNGTELRFYAKQV